MYQNDWSLSHASSKEVVFHRTLVNVGDEGGNSMEMSLTFDKRMQMAYILLTVNGFLEIGDRINLTWLEGVRQLSCQPELLTHLLALERTEEFGEPVYLEVTEPRLALARQIVLEGWRERAEERGSGLPEDASGSCKFASLFFTALFGGYLEGNEDHQFNFLNGVRYDLNDDCEDVLELAACEGDWVHTHDPSFFWNPEHVKSMESCLPRVRTWVARFKERDGQV